MCEDAVKKVLFCPLSTYESVVVKAGKAEDVSAFPAE